MRLVRPALPSVLKGKAISRVLMMKRFGRWRKTGYGGPRASVSVSFRTSRCGGPVEREVNKEQCRPRSEDSTPKPGKPWAGRVKALKFSFSMPSSRVRKKEISG